MTPPEEEALARALADVQCELPATEMEWLRRTATQLRAIARAEVPPRLADRGLSELMERIRTERAGLAPTPLRSDGWLRRASAAAAALFGPRAPMLAAALGVVVLVQAGVLAVLLAHRPAQLESQGAPPAPAQAQTALLTIGFVPDASETSIRATLVAAGAQLASGPSALGLYTIAVPRARADAALAALRSATGVVQSVQR